MPDFILPNDTQRLALFGRTGSGKTQASVWHLSQRRFDRMPWVVFNSKDDPMINDLPGTFDIDLSDRAPKSPGIYVCRDALASKEDKEQLDGFLQRCWARENIGLYFDEASDATGLPWFRRCLRQGRSRHVPMICVTQRPRWLDRYVWSEADFFQGFKVHLFDDKQTADQMVPGYARAKLPEFHSVWHDVKRGMSILLAPVPQRHVILDTFKARSPVQRRLIA